MRSSLAGDDLYEGDISAGASQRVALRDEGKVSDHFQRHPRRRIGMKKIGRMEIHPTQHRKGIMKKSEVMSLLQSPGILPYKQVQCVLLGTRHCVR